jgi:acylphosphatase
MDSAVGPERLHAYVSGRVQGVFFRRFVCREATGFGLTGVVRNLRDGRVEVVAEGDREVLERLVGRLHDGSAESDVRGVEVEWGEATGRFGGFRVDYE